MKKAKNKILYDILGVVCGLAVVATGLICGEADRRAEAANRPAAGTVLAVAEAEHTGKGVA